MENHVNVPESYHNDMLTYVRRLDQERKKRERKGKTRIWNQRVAVFLVAFVVLNVMALGTSEAYRQKVFKLFGDDAAGGIILRTENEYDLIGDWENYWYPTWMPDGFELYDADSYYGEFFMIYQSSNNEEIFIAEHESGTVLGYDTDTQEYKKIRVGIYDGMYFSDDENFIYTLVWLTDNHIIEVGCNKSNETELIKIAEGMKFIKF